MTKVYGKFMAKVIKVDVRLFFILAARIAFWVFVHCILGYLLTKIANYAIFLKLRIIKFAALLAPCGSNNRYMSNFSPL
jgi:hypothetical protein